jgi:hypothetical protein
MLVILSSDIEQRETRVAFARHSIALPPSARTHIFMCREVGEQLISRLLALSVAFWLM